VALTHMRMQNDINLGSQVPEIDIILGHHDHHYEVTPSDPHGTLVGKSGTDYRELRLLKIALGGYKLTRPRQHVCSCVICEQFCLPQ
jgi:5'-nucleotidase